MSKQYVFTGRHDGHVAVITGAGRGLGAAMAMRLAREGAAVVVNDLNKAAAQETATLIIKSGGRALANGRDVSLLAEARALVADTQDQFGQLDIMVNNAGITRDALMHKMEEERFDEVIRINLKGVFNCTQAAAAAMVPRKSGRIINISSISAFGNVGQANYSASKAGVIGLSKTAALELSRAAITVNVIAPGFFDTALTQAIPDDVKARFIQRIPLKRVGAPEEMAGLVAYLASDEAAYITGQVFVMDGGLTVGLSGV